MSCTLNLYYTYNANFIIIIDYVAVLVSRVPIMARAFPLCHTAWASQLQHHLPCNFFILPSTTKLIAGLWVETEFKFLLFLHLGSTTTQSLCCYVLSQICSTGETYGHQCLIVSNSVQEREVKIIQHYLFRRWIGSLLFTCNICCPCGSALEKPWKRAT